MQLLKRNKYQWFANVDGLFLNPLYGNGYFETKEQFFSRFVNNEFHSWDMSTDIPKHMVDWRKEQLEKTHGSLVVVEFEVVETYQFEVC